MHDSPIRILAGSASQHLGSRIAMGYGEPLCAVKHTVFSDGEFRVSIEETVRGKEVVIVQSTFPPSDNLMELLMLIDAAKRASAKRLRVKRLWRPVFPILCLAPLSTRCAHRA